MMVVKSIMPITLRWRRWRCCSGWCRKRALLLSAVYLWQGELLLLALLAMSLADIELRAYPRTMLMACKRWVWGGTWRAALGLCKWL